MEGLSHDFGGAGQVRRRRCAERQTETACMIWERCDERSIAMPGRSGVAHVCVLGAEALLGRMNDVASLGRGMTWHSRLTPTLYSGDGEKLEQEEVRRVGGEAGRP